MKKHLRTAAFNEVEIFVNSVKDILHKKRRTTEKHIEQLCKEGNEGVRYTAMIPDIPFLVLGIFSDIGWIVHLVAAIVYLCKNGFRHMADYLSLVALAAVLFGVACLA